MYHEEERITPYDGAVEIPKEIQAIRDPIIFNLTKRELLFVTIGILLAASSLWVLFRVVGVRSTGFVIVPVMVGGPFGLFAFIRPMGLNLEDWLTIWMSNNLKSAPVRKLFAIRSECKGAGNDRRKEKEDAEIKRAQSGTWVCDLWRAHTGTGYAYQ